MRKGRGLHALWLVGIAGVVACGGGTSDPGYSSNPPTAAPSAVATCSPAPCLVDQSGMVMIISNLRALRLANLKPGKHPVAVDVRWSFTGSGSRSPDPGQVYLIGPDKVVQSQTTVTDPAYPECADYASPELASGGTFGPKPICYLMDVAPTNGITLRWKHSIFGGPDQDLVLN